MVSILAEYERETPKSILFSINGKSVWMPKSQVSDYSATHMHCTMWIGSQKVEDGSIPAGYPVAIGGEEPESIYDGDPDNDVTYGDMNPPPYTDDDIPF